MSLFFSSSLYKNVNIIVLSVVSCGCMQLGKRQHRKTNQLCKSHFLGQCTFQHSAQQTRKIDRSENKSYARRTINLIIDFCEVKVKSGIFSFCLIFFFFYICVCVCARSAIKAKAYNGHAYEQTQLMTFIPIAFEQRKKCNSRK